MNIFTPVYHVFLTLNGETDIEQEPYGDIEPYYKTATELRSMLIGLGFVVTETVEDIENKPGHVETDMPWNQTWERETPDGPLYLEVTKLLA